jgi:cytochrome c5
MQDKEVERVDSKRRGERLATRAHVNASRVGGGRGGSARDAGKSGEAHARAVRMVKFSLILATIAFAFVMLGSRGDAQIVLKDQKDQNPGKGHKGETDGDRLIDEAAQRLTAEGRQTFRFDTFGDEAFWSDALQIDRAIKGAKAGGVGAGVSPKTALAVGLKVDLDALPQSLVSQLKSGRVDLDDPATTLALLKLNAVVGLKGNFSGGGNLTSVGISCTLCHSTVDDSLAPGIGRRLDGWANRDLNVGAITALSPNLQPVADLLGVDEATVRKVLLSWGPGKFDAQLFLDGKAFRPDGKSAATLIPPAFGLVGVNMHTSTGWGSVTYWNAFVANLEMHGKGTFYDPRLKDAIKFPVAARAGFDDVRSSPDLITAKLPALQFYQLAILAPTPPRGSFDAAAAARGEAVFNNQAKCATCHVPPLFTEPGWNMHKAEEIGIDDFQAMRSPDERYRTSPLKGLWTHQKGGFYHDGRFATLRDVVEHYDAFFGLRLGDRQKTDLVEYLKSL